MIPEKEGYNEKKIHGTAVCRCSGITCRFSFSLFCASSVRAWTSPWTAGAALTERPDMDDSFPGKKRAANDGRPQVDSLFYFCAPLILFLHNF